MRHLPAIAGALLGALFVLAGVTFFFMKAPELPAGSSVEMFFGAFGPTGYFAFIKILEIVGGVLVALPPTRRLGLLVLGPIIVNIIAFTVFVAKGNLADPMLVAIVVLSLFLVWAERRSFAAFIRGR